MRPATVFLPQAEDGTGLRPNGDGAALVAGRRRSESMRVAAASPSGAQPSAPTSSATCSSVAGPPIRTGTPTRRRTSAITSRGGVQASTVADADAHRHDLLGRRRPPRERRHRDVAAEVDHPVAVRPHDVGQHCHGEGVRVARSGAEHHRAELASPPHEATGRAGPRAAPPPLRPGAPRPRSRALLPAVADHRAGPGRAAAGRSPRASSRC